MTLLSTRPTVLVADDDAGVRALLAETLEGELGVRVVAVADGLKAISAAARENPDLVLLDLRMPVVDGYGVLRFLKNHATLGDVPVVALTGADTGDVLHALERGCRGYVQKPFDIDGLLDTVRPFLTPAAVAV